MRLRLTSLSISSTSDGNSLGRLGVPALLIGVKSSGEIARAALVLFNQLEEAGRGPGKSSWSSIALCEGALSLPGSLELSSESTL